jgi:hypothetical protein
LKTWIESKSMSQPQQHQPHHHQSMSSSRSIEPPTNAYPPIVHAPQPPQQQHYNGMYPPTHHQAQQSQYSDPFYPPQAPHSNGYMQPTSASMYAGPPFPQAIASSSAAATGGASSKRISQSDHNQPCTTLFLAKLDALSDDELLQMLQNSFGQQIMAHKFMIDRHQKRVAFVGGSIERDEDMD